MDIFTLSTAASATIGVPTRLGLALAGLGDLQVLRGGRLRISREVCGDTLEKLREPGEPLMDLALIEISQKLGA